MSNFNIERALKTVDYRDNDEYTPSEFAYSFIDFIKLVNAEGEENTTPIVHYRMLDTIAEKHQKILNMIFRGSGKTSLFAEYLFLYLAMHNGILYKGCTPINVGIYVSDSMDNGVKSMRKNLEHRWLSSAILQKYLPKTIFTDNRWELGNSDGFKLIIRGFGAKTGVRGFKEMAKRPSLAVLDDLVSDEDARSQTLIATIEDTVNKAIEYALHPTDKLMVWCGTPHNTLDPLYKAAESGVWKVNLYPVCERFPCTKEDFRGAWEDRFPYTYVKEAYESKLKQGKVAAFNQEMMLRIISEEDKLILNSDIQWFSVDSILKNKSNFNWYITTDFSTTATLTNDFSFISVWAYNNNGDWFWCDGMCTRQTMDKNIDVLFEFVSVYKPQSVGIEVSGQQEGFISWIRQEMNNRNIWFNLASNNNSSREGIRPSTNKFQRFNVVVPLFKQHKIFFAQEKRDSSALIELIEEIELTSFSGFKSKHDDGLDTVSMLALLKAWKPSEPSPVIRSEKSNVYYMPSNHIDKNTLDNYRVD